MKRKSGLIMIKTFDKPFFVTHLNSFSFALILISWPLHSMSCDFHALVRAVLWKLKRENGQHCTVLQTTKPVASGRGEEEEEEEDVEQEGGDADQPLHLPFYSCCSYTTWRGGRRDQKDTHPDALRIGRMWDSGWSCVLFG